MKQLLYTFTLIMLLMAGLLGTWWYQSYEHDRTELRKQVERDLDDLLVNSVFRKAVPFYMPNGPVWEGGNPIERFQRNKAYLDYSITSMRKNARIIRESRAKTSSNADRFHEFRENDPDPIAGPVVLSITETVEQLDEVTEKLRGEAVKISQELARAKNRASKIKEDGYPRLITIKDNPFRTDSQTFTFHFQDDGFTLGSMPNEVLDTLRYRYRVGLAPLRFSNQTGRLMATNPGMRIKTELINTGPGRDASYFEVTEYRATLLAGLLPEFLFGFLLFGATGFAFATAYRNLYEQDKQLKQKDPLLAPPRL